MSRGFKMAVRFLTIVAVLAATAYLFAPATSTSSPYESSLSLVPVQPAYAAGCSHSTCNPLRNPPNCTARDPNSKCKTGPHGCESRACP